MFGFFRNTRRKPRQFDYTPRSYDPEKEAREKRRRELLGDPMSTSDGEYVPGSYIRSQRMARASYTQAKREDRRKRNTVRTLIFLFLLILAAWYLIKF